MTHQVALTFEDGVTRFVEVDEAEPVADVALQAGINLPVDCMDGVCGSCKSWCESGSYELGEYIVDYAMTEEEERARFVLTCQLYARSDLVVAVPVSSALADVEPTTYAGAVTGIDKLSTTTTQLSIRLDDRAAFAFLPGQYVNIAVPGTDQTRSYSFSSSPAGAEMTFLLRNIPGGAMSSYLADRAEVGDRIEVVGPLGSFYLRPVQRRQLFLAGGTGLAPFLAMLEQIALDGTDHPVHLVYGVTTDADLVQVAELERLAGLLPQFTFTCCVADEATVHPNVGYVTGHVQPEHLADGDVDVSLCGPPAMVEAVRTWLGEQGVVPVTFSFEKFTGTGVVETGTVAAS